MQKQAPSLGRILVMVGFALSCFGLLLFLWLAFGGPIPLQPKGYRFTVAFTEAGTLSPEADVRISGVLGRQGQGHPCRQADGLLRRDDPARHRATRRSPRTRRRSCARRRCWARPTSSSRRDPRAPARFPRAGACRPARCRRTVELDEIFRAFDPKTRAAFQTWMQQLALASLGRGRDISDALGNLAPFAEDTTTLLKVLNAQHTDVQRRGARHRRGVRSAQRA